MAIRIRHDGAGAGAPGGGGGSSQRKYGQALVMQQQEANRRMQERQQDAMLAYGRERRGVVDDWNRRAEEDVRARQRFQMATDARREENQRMLDARRDDQAIDHKNRLDVIGLDHKNRMEVIGQGQDFQRRMMEDEIARSDKERRDQARLASAMAKGEIEQAIADGEFDEATARKLQQTFIDELAIIDDTYPDETQRDEALAQLRARRLRMAQNRKALPTDAPSQPQSALDAFNQNQEIEDRFMDLAREELAAGSDAGKPPVYDDIFKRAKEIYETRYGTGGNAGGQEQPRGSAPQPGGAPQSGKQANPFQDKDDTAIAEAIAGGISWKDKSKKDPLSDDYFARDFEYGSWKGEEFTKDEDLTRAVNSLSPSMRRAYRIARMTSRDLDVSDDAKQAASEIVRRAGIDMDLMKRIPAAKKQDWSALGSPSSERSGLGRLYAQSRDADPDIQNAIAILVNPKENEKDKEYAMEHLKNRNFDVMGILGY